MMVSATLSLTVAPFGIVTHNSCTQYYYDVFFAISGNGGKIPV